MSASEESVPWISNVWPHIQDALSWCCRPAVTEANAADAHANDTPSSSDASAASSAAAAVPAESTPPVADPVTESSLLPDMSWWASTLASESLPAEGAQSEGLVAAGSEAEAASTDANPSSDPSEAADSWTTQLADSLRLSFDYGTAQLAAAAVAATTGVSEAAASISAAGSSLSAALPSVTTGAGVADGQSYTEAVYAWLSATAVLLAQIWADVSALHVPLPFSDSSLPLVHVLAPLLVLLLLFSVWYHLLAVRRPRVYTQHIAGCATQLPPRGVRIDTESPGPVRAVRESVREGRMGKLLAQPYRPTPWLSFPFISGHLQTIYLARAPLRLLSTPYITYARELLRVEAGSPQLQAGEVALDWAALGLGRGAGDEQVREYERAYTEGTPTVLICHGLAGGGQEHYVKNLIFALAPRFRCVVFNARGCGGSKLLNGQLYCGAYTDDLRQVVANIRSRLPHAPLFGIGFSLGANILTKFAGEEGMVGRSPFSALVALANPFDFILGSLQLERDWFHYMVYSRGLAHSLISLFGTHADVLQREIKLAEAEAERRKAMGEDADECTEQAVNGESYLYDLASVFSAPSLREFDKRLTRLVFGYATVNDYYRDASSARFVKFLRCPSLFLNAGDDPISPATAWPKDECCINPLVTLVTTRHGGHSMDWFEGLRGGSWANRIVSAFLNDMLDRLPGVSDTAKLYSAPLPTPPPRDQPLLPLQMEAEAEESKEDGTSASWATAGQPQMNGDSYASNDVDAEPELMLSSMAAAEGLQARLDELESELVALQAS